MLTITARLAASAAAIDRQHPVVEMCGVEAVERDDLRGDVERGPAGDVQCAGVTLLATKRRSLGSGSRRSRSRAA